MFSQQKWTPSTKAAVSNIKKSVARQPSDPGSYKDRSETGPSIGLKCGHFPFSLWFVIWLADTCFDQMLICLQIAHTREAGHYSERTSISLSLAHTANQLRFELHQTQTSEAEIFTIFSFHYINDDLKNLTSEAALIQSILLILSRV